MALRREEAEDEPVPGCACVLTDGWVRRCAVCVLARSLELYAEVDPHCPRTYPGPYPAQLSAVESSSFGTFELGWIGVARAVDGQGLHTPASWPALANRWKLERWLKARKSLPPLLENKGTTRGGHMKAPLTRAEARLIARHADGADDERLDEREPWEAQQDLYQFQRWREKLPKTRNVLGPAQLSPDVHFAAGQVDARRFNRVEAEAYLADRQWAAMIGDREWLRAIYRLSAREALAMRLYLHGDKQELIATLLGVASGTAKEFLDRARKKMRDTCGLSPSTAPLRMRVEIRKELHREVLSE